VSLCTFSGDLHNDSPVARLDRRRLLCRLPRSAPAPRGRSTVNLSPVWRIFVAARAGCVSGVFGPGSGWDPSPPAAVGRGRRRRQVATWRKQRRRAVNTARAAVYMPIAHSTQFGARTPPVARQAVSRVEHTACALHARHCTQLGAAPATCFPRGVRGDLFAVNFTTAQLWASQPPCIRHARHSLARGYIYAHNVRQSARASSTRPTFVPTQS
jgi:hypothetical protein